jgi:hypothetical protein
MISFTKSSIEKDTERSTSEMELAFVTGLEICLALKLTLFYNTVLNKLINGIRTVCRTGSRRVEGNLEMVYA